MECIIFLIIIGLVAAGYIQDKMSTQNIEDKTYNYYTQNNINVQNNCTNKAAAHTSRVWERLGYEVNYGESYAYKYYGNEIYTEDQVRKISSSYSGYLSSNQKKVKSLGIALVKKSGSKQKAKNILMDHYVFDEDTAKYGAGFRGYRNW